MLIAAMILAALAAVASFATLGVVVVVMRRLKQMFGL